jgi:hypothetical protein
MFFRLVYGSRSNHLLLDQFIKYFIHVNVTRESSSLITIAVAKRYVIHLVIFLAFITYERSKFIKTSLISSGKAGTYL